MKHPPHASPASKVAVICSLHEAAIRLSAAAFRREHLIPFCRRYGASFVAGNGAWMLFLNRPTPVGDDLTDPSVCRAARIPAEALSPIVATLAMSLVPFGYHLTGPLAARAVNNRAGSFGYEVEDYDSR